MSGTKMTIFLLLSLVLVLSTESMVAPTVSYEYDELLLALQWPTSYCNTGKIRCNPHIPLEFTVHGLWPSQYSNRFFKCPTNYSIKNLYQQISSHLPKDWEKYWPNLNSQRGSEYLWYHEYENHGYCFTRFRDPVVYFQTALDIYFQTAANIATDIRNIMPTMRSSSGLYYVEDIRYVTIAGRKFSLGLRCNFAWKSAIPQLLEIVFCTDTNRILKNCTFVGSCNNQWFDRIGVDQSGWFQFPEVPASLSGSSRSPPHRNPMPSQSAIARNSPHSPHKFFSFLLLLIFYIE